MPPRKEVPKYDLRTIQAKVASGDRKQFVITQLAADEARSTLGFSEREIRDCIAQLDVASHFYKPMPATSPVAAQKGLWQDVYRTHYLGEHIYIKLQLDPRGVAVVVQFKRK